MLQEYSNYHLPLKGERSDDVIISSLLTPKAGSRHSPSSPYLCPAPEEPRPCSPQATSQEGREQPFPAHARTTLNLKALISLIW